MLLSFGTPYSVQDNFGWVTRSFRAIERWSRSVSQEKGTWTPTVSFGGGSVDLTYAVQLGKYSKLDDLVLLWFKVTLTSNGTSTGAAVVGGYPFTFLDDSIGYGHLLAGGSSATGVYPVGAATGKSIALYIPGGTASAAATHSNLSDTFSMIGTILHRV